MIYLSKLGVSFVLLGLMLYMVALQSASGLLFLVLGILFGCYVINLLAARRVARQLALVPPERMIGTEETPITGTWEIANRSQRILGLAEARSPWGNLFRIGALAGGEIIHITPTLTLPRRGVYPFGRLWLISSYPFGLVRCRQRLSLKGEFVVHPGVYACPAPVAAGFEPMVGGRYTGQNRSSSGDSFHGVRPMQSSDPVKLIHWPSSSKGLGIMVKEFDEELSGRVCLVMDAGDGKAPDGDGAIDWAARATGSLVLAALDAGHQVEYTNLADLAHLSVPPFADGSVVLDALARLRPSPGALTRERLNAALAGMPSRASLCLILTEYTPDVAAFLNLDVAPTRRKTALYLPVWYQGQLGEPYGTVHYYAAREMADQ